MIHQDKCNTSHPNSSLEKKRGMDFGKQLRVNETKKQIQRWVTLLLL
jgi:hypothetical protein